MPVKLTDLPPEVRRKRAGKGVRETRKTKSLPVEELHRRAIEVLYTVRDLSRAERKRVFDRARGLDGAK